MRVRELAEWLNASAEGDGEREISNVAPLEKAGASDLSFAANRKAYGLSKSSAAGCLIVPMEYENPGGRTIIRVAEPRTAFARSIERLRPRPAAVPGIDPSASVAATAFVHPSAEVGPHTAIAEGARVGAACRIGPGCSIGRGVTIGEGSWLHANVSIYEGVDIGARAVLHSGCVIGADGFGFVMTNRRYKKFPQIGGVLIGDDVEIGANSCIDRAALGVTSIGDGTKLDNMVHVGHNCRIGRHVVVAAQTGFSGAVVVEDYAVIGGQVGIGDKARIESGAVLGSGCGVLTSKIVRGGQVVWGTPARPLKEYLLQLANLARLPELRKSVAELRTRLQKLEGG